MISLLPNFDDLELWTPAYFSWARSTISFVAIAWLFFRALHVFSKSIEELIALLGLDVPPVPSLSLFLVRADGLVVHWSPNATLKGTNLSYHIYVNGVNIGEAPSASAYLAIGRLLPAHNYTVRMVACNHSSFQSASDSVRARTKPISTGHFLDQSPASQVLENTSDDSETSSVPVVFPYNLTDGLVANHNPSISSQDVPSRRYNKSHAQKSHPVSVSVPAATATPSATMAATASTTIPTASTSATHDSALNPTDVADISAGSVSQLTDRLEELQKKHEEEERRCEIEVDEFKTQLATLEAERDEAKKQLKERDDGAKNMKKTLKDISNSNTEAQLKRSAHERTLGLRQAEVQKLEEDRIRFQKDTAMTILEAEKLEANIASLEKELEKALLEIQERITKEQTSIRGFEESIRKRGIRIKQIDERRRASSSTLSTEPHPHKSDSRLAHYRTMLAGSRQRKQMAESQLAAAMLQYEQVLIRQQQLQVQQQQQQQQQQQHQQQQHHLQLHQRNQSQQAQPSQLSQQLQRQSEQHSQLSHYHHHHQPQPYGSSASSPANHSGLARRRAATGLCADAPNPQPPIAPAVPPGLTSAFSFPSSLPATHHSQASHATSALTSTTGPVNVPVCSGSYTTYLCTSNPLSTSGTLMSPSAEGALLPSGLLGDEADMGARQPGAQDPRSIALPPSTDTSDSAAGFLSQPSGDVVALPGLGALETLESAVGVSHHGSPTLAKAGLANPSNLSQGLGGPGRSPGSALATLSDSDGNSIMGGLPAVSGSMNACGRMRPGTRFGNIFSLNATKDLSKGAGTSTPGVTDLSLSTASSSGAL